MSKYVFEFGHSCEHEPHFDEIDVGALAKQLIAQIPEREMLSFARAIKLAYSHMCENHAMNRARVFWASSEETKNYFSVDLVFTGERYRLDGKFTTPRLELDESKVRLQNVPVVMHMAKARKLGDLASLPFEGFSELEIAPSDTQRDHDETIYTFERLPTENCANLYPEWC